ncbi:antitermination protein Q [Xenorhabdus mauleonii]|uniref:Antitermination protein Q n=1 Tax=Xenorhabdus mauleonii TaxID=351675 RepID=A0A1I3U4N8_9GAMM|nr:bacteriophage antitermination protein Q [Xenorhabdus mauleonii]PHM45899.1 antitermination protein Q [Xenorhabdus mauleonii]SFJ77865.1 Phage antitermination protein Q [Xenorhabdus mauleonii]
MRSWYLHDLAYVRTQIIPALANIEGETKGQLAAFEDSPLICTDYYKRNQVRIKVGNRWVIRDADPVFCLETRMNKQPKPPISPITYHLSSWRRAVLAINESKLAWVMYCYGYDLDYRHQIEICRYLWSHFLIKRAGRKLSAKVVTRLMGLVWLVAQQHARICRSESFTPYSNSELARLAGVSLYNWKKRYTEYWEILVGLCERLDMEALQEINKRRTDQVDLQMSPKSAIF